MLGQYQYSNYKKFWVQIHTFVAKNHNVAGVLPGNVKKTVPRINAIAWTTHIFDNDRQLRANDCIQEQKPLSTKNKKGTIGHGLVLYKIVCCDEKTR